MLKIPDILTSEKLLEKAFRKTKKVQIVDRDLFYRKKKTIIAKTESFATIIITELEEYVKKFPSINNLSLFYQEILSIKIDVGKLKKSLGAIDWAHKTSKQIFIKQIKSMRTSSNITFLQQKQNEIYGRISSVIKQINKELKFVKDAQLIIKELPEIQDIPTVVIAGYPNVGKSSLLRCLSSAKPAIANYPFTTKQIYIGHMEFKERYSKKVLQIIDTPGLLDRPLKERNEIEKQAIAALSYLADIIIFIFDPTETCGYPIDNQKNLLTQLKKMFKDSEFIVVENKSDVQKYASDNIKVSCENKEGIDILIEEILKNYKK